ncbi:MAG: fumarylacetoacetate hydrolase family protein, partial [Alphaproteobacteria bacterium]|nr:fumarylacetoacetate hydrolase family protein [Alphaproteobacteria bacterium]
VKARMAKLPLVGGRPRIGTPLPSFGNLICIGLNYADHAAEAGQPIPAEPIIFFKHSSALTGPNDTVAIPRGSMHTDWECELAVVIGRTARYVKKQDALRYVAGYTICNDVSERNYQIKRSGGQWSKGKSSPGFAPVGPWLVTRDEIKDPQKLKMTLAVNGKLMQNGSTATMIFDVATLVSHLSEFMTLLPGDLISTGTPPGVGSGIKPNPVFLKAGDVMELSIEGLGTQRQKCVATK